MDDIRLPRNPRADDYWDDITWWDVGGAPEGLGAIQQLTEYAKARKVKNRPIGFLADIDSVDR